MKKIKNTLPTIERLMGGGILESKRKNPKRRLERNILLSLTSIVALVVLVSFSYAYIQLNKEEKEVNVVGTDCISLEMEEVTNAITLQNTFPVSDEVGKTTPPYRFKLRNNCGVGLNYEIHLEVEEGNTMNAKNVATMVDDNNKIILASDKQVENEENKGKYRISEVFTLEPYKEVEHEVRIWLDSSADNDSQNKKFLSKVIIEAVQNQSVCTYESKWDFNYTNNEQTFIVPCDGVYLLEVWGAQGGVGGYDIEEKKQHGGLGGYSKGEITLTASETLYINVGSQGEEVNGGYNGGGNGSDKLAYNSFGGGGATHIAKVPGLLSQLENHKDDGNILIVAGGGGGSSPSGLLNERYPFGGVGGGIKGGNGINTIGSIMGYIGTGGTQNEGGYNTEKATEGQGAFGLGGNYYNSNYGGSGGGGGYYGGGGSSRAQHTGGGGGSGYIGNELLTNKGMWCYQCEESQELETRTTSTDQVSEEPISMYAKQGNGFARITYLRIK